MRILKPTASTSPKNNFINMMRPRNISYGIRILAVTCALMTWGGCSTSEPVPEELIIEDLEVGDGEEATDGAILTVHYVGMYEDGRLLDTSYSQDGGESEPFQFVLGARQVIQGWEEGVLGMREGGRRRLTIPPRMAYGGQENLIFDIDLLEVTKFGSD
jgi:hypothetical protein